MPTRRRNKPEKSRPVEPCAAPGMPSSYRVFDGATTEPVRFLKASREFYGAWVAEGEAAGFGAADWLFLRDVVLPLYDRVQRGSSLDNRREVRMQVDKLEKLAKERSVSGSSEREQAEPKVVSPERRERLLTVVSG